MDFRFQNQRNYQSNFDQDWNSNNNLSLPTVFPETNFQRNVWINYPFSRMGDNVRNQWGVRNDRRHVRPAMRRISSLNDMRNSLMRATHEMYEVYDDFDDSRGELQEARIRLEDVKNEVIQMKTALQNSIAKLDTLVSNFQNPRMLNSLNARDRNIFQRLLDNVKHDVEEARTRLREVEGDFDEEDTRQYAAGPSGSGNNSANNAKRMRTSNMTEAGTTSSNNEEDKNDKSEGLSSCSVCMENAVNAVLYTCGHMCMCFSCARKLLRHRGDNRRCPMCRAVIRDIIKIYRC